MRVVIKSKRFMGEYIAVNGRLPKRELPMRMRNMKTDDIYIRENIIGERRQRITLHEFREMRYLKNGLSYKDAHRKAGY